MADATTTKLSLTLPEVDVSTTWATELNNNFTTLDNSVLLTNTQTLTNKTLTDCVANTQSSSDNSTKIATTEYVDSTVVSVTSLSGLSDTNITSIADNDILTYDSSSAKYINESASEAGLATTSDLSSKLDTSAHTKASLDVDHLITLSGVTDASDHLGTFTGSTISDNDTVKGAIQDLETAVETKQASLTFGISNTNAVKVDSTSVADDEYARFTANGLESRSASEVLSDIGGQASLTNGISNTNNVVIDSASVADDEYARFTASGLESRSTSEVLSDIGAQASITSSARLNADLIHDGTISNTEFGHLNGVSSNIQTQLNNSATEADIVALSIALG